jgi:hypothetical protein
VNHGDQERSPKPEACFRSVDEPNSSGTGNNRFTVVKPQLIGDRSQKTDEPLPTLTTKNGLGLVNPYLVKFYGTGTYQPIDDPLDTVTTKDRFGLVNPTLLKIHEGLYLGIRFRMLQDHELANIRRSHGDGRFDQ